MQTIVTHNGSFHADDVFGVAALRMHLMPEEIKIIRTRDRSVIETGDWVLDVGGIYDPSGQRFDHHQNGAPVRENGIPYAAFGLVWKHVGEQLAGSSEAADLVEQKLVMPIDAGDNGVSLFSLTHPPITPFGMHDLATLFLPAWNTPADMNENFNHAVQMAHEILSRAITHAKADIRMHALVKKTYGQTANKTLLEFTVSIPSEAFIDYPEVNVVVCPHDPAVDARWEATTIRKGRDSFEPRAKFPESWAGLSGAELAKESEIPDAIFAHKARFYFVAESRESALAAAAKVQ